MADTIVYRAQKIITMDPNRPDATHVMVREGRILAVGGDEVADLWGGAPVDDRYADKVLMPGLIEAHAHVSAGGVWRYIYCGHYTRTDPQGRPWPGVTEVEALVARLREAAKDLPAGVPVIGWGFDPARLSGALDRQVLDRVADDRPVVVLHSNFHLMNTNTAALAAVGMDKGSNIPGVMRGADGKPSGELQEFAAMGPVMDHVGLTFATLGDASGLRAYGAVARNCGVTTVADLLSDLDTDEVAMLRRVTAEDDFPVRYVPMMNAMRDAPGREAERARDLRALSTDRLRLGGAKLFTDGAIQGWTAQLNAPGYYTGTDHGLWNMEVADFRHAVATLHAAGVKVHVHTNGDAASELAIEAFAEAHLKTADADHRHVLEHVQLADRAQFLRMRKLGLCVNVFANHLYYFGDTHWGRTLGPDRAARMDACRDAAEVYAGDFAIHSDAPVTPMSPLFTAWCAVNRRTEGGRVLGDSQQIPVATALRCITMGAAHVLKLDHEVGSIATGKRADFCVLDADPLQADPAHLHEVPVAGTVMGGRHFDI
ncbi:amidohydrolase [Pararhodobacter sp. SW119]|uniref:amidohydrolase n=1 Tax=Pararhodobacter sp. SW119 TaxID=2780075 RepID=UPI001AE09435|nr:amidohydrolase [Pararhodobacter sp. SW119]